MDKIDQSPEAIERQAQRRLARQRNLEAEQRQLRRERAGVVHAYALRFGSAGLIEVEGVGEKGTGVKLKDSLEVVLDKRLLLLPAEHTIQGETGDDNFANAKLGEIAAHQDAFGKQGILGFEDVDFSGQSGAGTPAVAEHVTKMLSLMHRGQRDGLAIVAFGAGSIRDFPSSPQYDRSVQRGPFVSRLGIMLGIDMHGEPKPIFDHAIYADPTATLYGPAIMDEGTDTGPGMDLLG